MPRRLSAIGDRRVWTLARRENRTGNEYRN